MINNYKLGNSGRGVVEGMLQFIWKEIIQHATHSIQKVHLQIYILPISK